MDQTKSLSGLASIASDYDAILCDVWGVVHNGRAAFEAACEALVKFRAQGGRVIFVTNAPVPKAQVIRYFEPLGVPDEAFDDCISSGDATRNELKRRQEQSIWRMGADEGWEHDKFLYEGLDLTFATPEDADILLCIGLEDQVDGHPEDYRETLQIGSARSLPMICANPDIQVRIGDKLYWCAGALARIYEELGGSVIYPGKPYAAIYRLARERLAASGGLPDASRILVIGDSPITDIRGAINEGYDSLYVGTGLATHGGGEFMAEATAEMRQHEALSTWAMPALSW